MDTKTNLYANVPSGRANYVLKVVVNTLGLLHAYDRTNINSSDMLRVVYFSSLLPAHCNSGFRNKWYIFRLASRVDFKGAGLAVSTYVFFQILIVAVHEFRPIAVMPSSSCVYLNRLAGIKISLLVVVYTKHCHRMTERARH